MIFATLAKENHLEKTWRIDRIRAVSITYNIFFYISEGLLGIADMHVDVESKVN